MLVITMKPGERVVIGDNITVMFVGKGQSAGSAKIGVEAPREVPILRNELAAAEEARRYLERRRP